MPKNYYQATGRPNAGMDDPERFGLTQTEIIDLINTNQWQAFYRKWWIRQNKLEKIRKLDFICPKCYNYVENVDDWVNSVKYCKKCSYKTKGFASFSKDKAVKAQSQGGSNSNLGNQIKTKCSFCGKTKEVSQLYHKQICSECRKRFNSMVNR